MEICFWADIPGWSATTIKKIKITSSRKDYYICVYLYNDNVTILCFLLDIFLKTLKRNMLSHRAFFQMKEGSLGGRRTLTRQGPFKKLLELNMYDLIFRKNTRVFLFLRDHWITLPKGSFSFSPISYFLTFYPYTFWPECRNLSVVRSCIANAATDSLNTKHALSSGE